MNHLKTWKHKAKRKPLIVRGARQVGKTWLIKKFGKEEYAQMAYINLRSQESCKVILL